MNIASIVLGVGFVGILAKPLAWVDGRDAQPHLGFVSHRWLVDHRLSEASDGAIIISDSAKEKPQRGEVIAAGSGRSRTAAPASRLMSAGASDSVRQI
jgi:hypothetical protein